MKRCEPAAGTPDRDLVASARRGDRQAFGELVYRHRDGVVRVVVRMVGDFSLAEDAAQEAFIRAWQRLHTYHVERPFRNWIFGIAIHAALDILRRERETSEVETLDLVEGSPSPETQAESHENQAIVRQAVHALPPGARAVLVLREYEGFSYAEIARVLSIPVGTVMSRLSYARSQLRLALAATLERK